MPKPTRYIGYFRVSTARQGRSGLGLEAQQAAVQSYIDATGGTLVQSYVEVESGKRNDRPELAAALAACRLHKAVLLLHKLDRLARNVAFVSSLMESNVEFVAVDFPEANRLTIHILAAVAEHEARAISDRTKAALGAAKARGVVLGGYRGRAGTAADCSRARATQAALADQRAQDVAGTIQALRAAGVSSLGGIAARLNERGITTPRGSTWSAVQVRRTLQRLSVQSSASA